jgi:hypothetical protein
MGWVLLALSIALAAASCRAGMRLLARSALDRFWVRVLVIPCQLSGAAMLTSLLHAFAPGPFLAAQAAIAAILWLIWWKFGPPPAGGAPARNRWRVDPVCVSLLVLLGALLVVGVIHAMFMPMFGVDDRMYHGSRVLHWLQNRSIFFYETHNDRQVSFPFGAELFFAWPLLFVKEEMLGRVFQWIVVPATCFGVSAVCRAIGLSRRTALAGALAYAATPTVQYLGATLKSDLWQPLFGLGMAFYLLAPRSGKREQLLAFALAGAMLALAMNVKMTALALAPGIFFAAWNGARPRDIGARLGAAGAGVLACACVCGLAVLIGSNLVHYKRPLGPAWIARLVSPEYSPSEVLVVRRKPETPERTSYKALVQHGVHAARAVVYLIEFPEVPGEGLRTKLDKYGNKLAHALRADKQLEFETGPGWPGQFKYKAQHSATAYSLWGMFWIPALVIGSLAGLRRLGRTFPRPNLDPPVLLIAIQLPMFLGVVFLIRWMGDGPDRFWLSAFALVLPVQAWLAERLISRSAVAGGIILLLVMATGLATLRGNIQRLDWFTLHPLTPAHMEDRMAEVVSRIPPASRILLAAGESTRDYGLFDPAHRYSNKVFLWGKRAFEPEVAQELLDQTMATHIVIENDVKLAQWDVLVETGPLVAWLDNHRQFETVPVPTPNLRLYRRRQ